MIDSVLNAAVRPGEYSSRMGGRLGGRHLGVIPMVIAGIFVVLLLGGILWGASSRFQSGEEEAINGASVSTSARPSYELPRLLDENDLDLEGYIPGKPDIAAYDPDVMVAPAVSDALKAQREYVQQQRMRELQNRTLGQESSPSVSTSELKVSRETETAGPPLTGPSLTESPLTGSSLNADIPPDSTRSPTLEALLAEARSRPQADPGGQAGKIRFLNESDQKAWLPHIRQADLGRYTLKTGAVIPGVLISGLNSDLPGNAIAQVSQNVYDSATGQHLLIPQGSKLYGTYDSRISYGQNRALVVWERILFPDASTLALDRMQGVDVSGYSGFKDKVNNHYLKLFGQTFLLSAIQALPAQISDTPTASGADDEFSKIAAVNYSRMGEKLIDRNLSIQPTIRIRPGYPFLIMVNKDMLFQRAYGA